MLAGTNKNLDLALDVAVAVSRFFYPKLKLTGYASAAEAQANVDAAMKVDPAAGWPTRPSSRAPPAGCSGSPR